MPWKSIRFRLTVWYSLALAAALAIFAISIWLSMRHSLRRDLDHTLSERMADIESFLRDELRDPAVNLPKELGEYAHAFPYGTSLQVQSIAGPAIFTSDLLFPWNLAASSERPRSDLRWRQHSYRVFTQEVSAGAARWRVIIVVSLESIDAVLRRLCVLLFTLVPLVIIIAAFGGAWLSRRALKPVDAITAAARNIGIRNLSERLPVDATGDELQNLAQTWNSMLARLEDAVLRLSRFTSDASHELRTPLTVIRTTAEIASRKSRSPEAYRTALDEIVSESERMTALIEDLLFLARCDSDDLQLPKGSLPLDRIIEEVCSSMQPVAEAAGIHLIGENPGNSCEILGNEAAVRRLLMILVDNAIKYCKPGGCARVSASVGGDKIQLSVEDEGPGILASDLPFVFQRFYRGSHARDKGNTGFGLGLALASGIAEQHRSTIAVDSTEKGAVFTVKFPTLLNSSESG